MGKMKELDIETRNSTNCLSTFFSEGLSLFLKSDNNKFKPVEVMYDFPYTIVEFADGTKTCVRCHNEAYDYEKGLAMAIAKRVMTRADFDRLVNSGKTIFENKMEKNRSGKKNNVKKVL